MIIILVIGECKNFKKPRNMRLYSTASQNIAERFFGLT